MDEGQEGKDSFRRQGIGLNIWDLEKRDSESSGVGTPSAAGVRDGSPGKRGENDTPGRDSDLLKRCGCVGRGSVGA